MQPMSIAGRPIDLDHPPFIIAELSANHNGNLERAKEIIRAAATSGADAIKLQTYTAESLTIDCDAEDFLIKGGLWNGRTLYDLYCEAQTPLDWHQALFEEGRAHGITVFSSAFDRKAADLLVELGAPAFKIASFELVDIPLISYVAGLGRPMILSTGLANLEEIEEAVRAARSGGCEQLAILHCISGYPTPIEEANLRAIGDLRRRFSVEVGLSDHTLGTVASTVATAMGASLIEKHVTLRRSDGGPDSAFSLEPQELAELVRSTRQAWESLGRADHGLAPSEAANLRFRRSLYAIADIEAGAPLTERNVRSIRPGFGLKPKFLPDVLKRRAVVAIPRGTPLSWQLLEGGEPGGDAV